MIDFHCAATGNNLKIAIMLNEIGLPHRLVKYDLLAGTHLTPEFRRINLNNKVPAIVDSEPRDGGEPLAVFESGAILLYLAEKTGKLLPRDFRGRLSALQWLTWQVAGLGPMLGQAHHCRRYAPEGQDYGVQRYTREARRHIDVMEYRVRDTEYFAGEFSIADIACYPWVNGAPSIGIDLSEYPQVSDWLRRVGGRPSIKASVDAIYDENRSRVTAPRVPLTPAEWSNMFGDRMFNAARVNPGDV